MNHAVTFLSAWTFEPVAGCGLIAAAFAYLWGVRIVNRRRPDSLWPRRLTASYLSGLALVWLVVLGPVGAYDDTFFWAHMVQHIVLMMLAAPILLLGAPVLLLLRASTPAFRRRFVVPVLRSRIVVALTHPAVSWLLFAGVLTGTHFSPFFNYSLEHPLVHDYVEHPLYLFAALLFYYPLLNGNPAPKRLSPGGRAISLFLMMLPETMTGFFIYSSNYLLYPFYATAPRSFGPSPLADQQLAGSLMWAGSMLIDSVWVTIAVLEWLHTEERKSRRVDLETLAATTLPLSTPQ
ncbi:MAG: cytochrome c oxidase assembly protein [Acidothermaceae bacterium]